MKRIVALASAIICLMFLVFGAASLKAMIDLRAAITQMQVDNQEIKLFGDFDTNLVRAAGEAATFINTHDMKFATEAEEALEHAQNAHDQLTELLNQSYSDGDENSSVSHLHEHRGLVLAQLKQNTTEVIQAIHNNPADQPSNQQLLDKVYAYEAEAVHMREEMESHLSAEQIAHSIAVDQVTGRLVSLRVIFFLLFLLILVAAFIIVQNRLVNPLNLLSEAAVKVANGNLETSVSETGRDEISMLQRAFNKMVQDLRHAFNERDMALEQSMLDKNAAEAANRAKSSFLANMSHELRTPLTAISGWTTILQDKRSGVLNDDQAYGLQVIEHSSQHLLALINDVLDLAKIEAGKMELHPEHVYIEPICQESIESIKTMAQRKQISIEYTQTAQLASMFADARALKQMLVNLLSNAVKFTDYEGQIKLEVFPDETQEHMLFRVKDTGIGIAPEHMTLLFQPFVQIDSSLTRHEQGSGLGLVLSHRLAVLHGGDISVESTLGVGSIFTIRLPLQSIDQSSVEAADLVPAQLYINQSQ